MRFQFTGPQGNPPLPPPTTAATTQVYIDSTGETWVAINSVNGGNWARARDVLFCRVYMVGAYTFPSGTAAAIPWDTVARDNYHIYDTIAHNFTPPISGFYFMHAQFHANATAVGQLMSITFAPSVLRAITYSGAAGSQYVSIADIAMLAGGTAYSNGGNTTPALAMTGLDIFDSQSTLKWMGSG